MKPQKIKFISEGADKYYRSGNLQFLAIKQGREGYTLSASVWHTQGFSQKLQLDYAPPTSLDNIRTRIFEIIANNSNK